MQIEALFKYILELLNTVANLLWERFLVLGVVVFFVVAYLLITKTKIGSEFKDYYLLDSVNDPLNIATTALSFSTLVLAVIYVSAGVIEQRWAKTFYRQFFPEPDALALVGVIIAASMLAFIVISSTSNKFPIFYTLFVVIDSFICILYLISVQEYVRAAVDASVTSPEQLKAVVDFYNIHAWLILILIKTAASLILLFLSIKKIDTRYYYILLIIIPEVYLFAKRVVLYKSFY